MQNKNEILKPLALISLLILVFQFILSIIFYKERIAFLDASYILFGIINEQSLQIQVGRIGSFITQMFPLIGVKLGIGLKGLMLIYSMSFTMFNLLAGTLAYKWKQYEWVIALAMYHVLFSTDAYFWTNNEIHQAVSWLTIAWAWYLKEKDNDNYKYLGALPLMGIAVWTHPLVLIIVSYVVFYYFFTRQLLFKNKKNIIWLIAIIISIASKYFYGMLGNYYDSYKVESIRKSSLPDVFAIFDRPMMQVFLDEIWQYYWAPLLLFIISLLLLYSRKRWMLLLSYLYIFCYLIAVALVYYSFFRFYSESIWMCMTFFIVFPILYIIKDMEHLQKVILASFSIIILLWGIQFKKSICIFKNRTAWHHKMIKGAKAENKSKLFIQNFPQEKEKDLQMTWGVPNEALFLSTIIDKDNPVTYFYGDTTIIPKSKMNHISCFNNAINYKNLNPHYFKIDTFNYYEKIDYQYLMK